MLQGMNPSSKGNSYFSKTETQQTFEGPQTTSKQRFVLFTQSHASEGKTRDSDCQGKLEVQAVQADPQIVQNSPKLSKTGSDLRIDLKSETDQQHNINWFQHNSSS
jgi:hypothetical protein